MNYREMMLSAIRGEEAKQHIPWAPRMDLWYIANRANGLLPEKLKGMNMVELANEFDFACHAVGADYTIEREAEEHFLLTGFVLDTHPDYAYRIKVSGLPTEFDFDGENYRTKIQTSVGEVTTHAILTEEMKKNGISYPFVKSHPIKSEKDFEAVAEVFEHLEVIPTPDEYAKFHERVGESGLAVATGLISGSPMHIILHGLMEMQKFFMAWNTANDELQKLATRITPFFDSVLDAVVKSKAETVFWGANYDQNITWPPFFKEHIAPYLQKVGERLHLEGKLLLTHTDGENKALLPHYHSCNIDVAESVCPAPMTKCSLKEFREGLGKNTAVWGGIPATALLDANMNDDQFESYMDQLFSEIGCSKKLILGVSDNVPAEANMTRLASIQRRIIEFGVV